MIIKKLDEPKRIIAPPDSKTMKSRYQVLSPGEEVGEHKTDSREEVIIILAGEATITEEGKEFKVLEKQAVYIAPETIHNVINRGKEDLHYVYVVSLFGKDNHKH